MMNDASAHLPEYDDLPLGALEHRIRSLNAADLRSVLDYEREHANRTPVLELLTARLDELDRGAQPSSGDQENPVETTSTRGESPVGPDSAAEHHTPQRHGQTPHRDRP